MVPDDPPSDVGPSRRTLLAATAAIGASGLAGCSASASSDSVDCVTNAVDRGDGAIFQQAVAMLDEEAVVLLVSLQEPADTLPVASIRLGDDAGNRVAEIPTTDAREYRVTLGSPPQHGRLTLSAVDEQGTEVDTLGIEYDCTDD